MDLEEDKTISIIGFRDVKIDDVNEFLKKIRAEVQPLGVQVLDAEYVAGKPHLYFAFINAKKSFEENQAICDNLEMETLLYASGHRQINRAISMLGIKSQTTKVAVILFGSDEGEVDQAKTKLVKLVEGARDDSVLDVKKEKIEGLMKTFSITKIEVETMIGIGNNLEDVLTWLIVERGALLPTKR